MADEADHTRRWLMNAGGAAILSGAIPGTTAHAQTTTSVPAAASREVRDDPISPTTVALADYVAGALVIWACAVVPGMAPDKIAAPPAFISQRLV